MFYLTYISRQNEMKLVTSNVSVKHTCTPQHCNAMSHNNCLETFKIYTFSLPKHYTAAKGVLRKQISNMLFLMRPVKIAKKSLDKFKIKLLQWL